MLLVLGRAGGEIGVCGTCMDARGMTEDELSEGARRRTLRELSDWQKWVERTRVF